MDLMSYHLNLNLLSGKYKLDNNLFKISNKDFANINRDSDFFLKHFSINKTPNDISSVKLFIFLYYVSIMI